MNYYPEKYFNEKVYIFAKTIKNIFLNFIHYEPILCDDRDPPWISNKINKLINENNTSYQFYIQKVKMNNHFKSFRPFITCYYLQLKFPNNSITHGFLKKLMDSSTCPKAYW